MSRLKIEYGMYFLAVHYIMRIGELGIWMFIDQPDWAVDENYRATGIGFRWKNRIKLFGIRRNCPRNKCLIWS